MIEKLSRRLGIDLHYFLPRGLWVSSRFFAVTFITLLISVAMARLTSKEIFGQYQYVISVASLLSVLSLPGLNTAALRAFVEGDKRSVDRSIKYSFLSSLLGTVIMVGFGVYKYFDSSPLLGLSLVSAGILLPFFYAPNNWYVYYEGNLDFKSSTVRIVILNVTLLIGMVLGLLSKSNVVGLVVLYFGIQSLAMIYFYWEAKRQIDHSSSVNRLSLAYAIKCTVQKFTSTLGENVQTIAISSIFGFANLAIYQVAQSFVNAFLGLTGAISSTYFPLLLKYKEFNYSRMIGLHLILGVIFWVVYYAAVKLFFTPLYGATYQGAIDLAYRISFIVLLLPLRVYLNNFFTARDLNRVNIATNLGASLLALVTFLALRNNGFFLVSVYYLYVLNILMLVPLLFIYMRFSQASTQ